MTMLFQSVRSTGKLFRFFPASEVNLLEEMGKGDVGRKGCRRQRSMVEEAFALVSGIVFCLLRNLLHCSTAVVWRSMININI